MPNLPFFIWSLIFSCSSIACRLLGSICSNLFVYLRAVLYSCHIKDMEVHYKIITTYTTCNWSEFEEQYTIQSCKFTACVFILLTNIWKTKVHPYNLQFGWERSFVVRIRCFCLFKWLESVQQTGHSHHPLTYGGWGRGRILPTKLTNHIQYSDNP